jgi:hypothetical protein
MGSICHIGIAVPDLEKGQKELGEVFGLRWRPARVRKLTLTDAAGRPYAVECHVAFSLGGPFATAGTTPLLNRGPAGTSIELCDLHSDRPSLRDLFPPGSEFAGEPLLDSAL